MTIHLSGQRLLDPVGPEVIPLSDEIYAYFGNQTAQIFRDVPNNSELRQRPELLVIIVEVASARMHIGPSAPSELVETVPTENILDGSGTFPLTTGTIYVFSAPEEFTIKGIDGTAVVTYYWV